MRFAVVASQLISRDLADSVGGAGVEAGGLTLWNLFRLAEHLARPGEIEAGAGGILANGGQQEMRPVDIRIEGRKLVIKRVADVALGSEMITFMRPDCFHHGMNAGAALERSSMEVNAVE